MRKIRNLIAIDEGRRFIWNVSIGQLEFSDGDAKQTLLLTSRPYFNVVFVKLNVQKNLLALIGDQGITIVELPNKWSALYNSGKDRKLYCNSINICENLFKCDKRVKILHADWHPVGSEAKHTICFLTNDNRLRFCNPFDESDQQVIQLQPHASSENQSEDDDIIANMSLLNIGEAAVYFDFGPPITTCDTNPLWPIYILTGTSDILLIYTNPDNPDYAENIVGPLTILPQAEDNYGSDACSMIVLDSHPTMLAIATPSGLIYHAFAFVDNKSLLPPQTLYMYECIELAKDLIENSNDPYIPHNIILHKDPTSKLRYFCVHHNGVHTVVCPIIDCLETEPDVVQDKESLSEFLVCTRISTPSDSNTREDTSPRGIGVEIKASGMSLVVLTDKNDILEHRISPATTLISRRALKKQSDKSKSYSDQDELGDVSQLEASRADFELQITQILKRSANLPMLKLSEKSEQNLNINELLAKTISTLKVEYLDKFKLALEAIKKKTEILKNDIENQTAEYKNLLKDKDEMYACVLAVSSKAEKACQKQSEILKRIDRLLATVTFGNLSEQCKELNGIREKILIYRNELDSVINKHKYNLEQRESGLSKRQSDDQYLSRNQLEGIKDTLTKQGADIAELKRVVKKYKSKQN